MEHTTTRTTSMVTQTSPGVLFVRKRNIRLCRIIHENGRRVVIVFYQLHLRWRVAIIKYGTQSPVTFALVQSTLF